MTEIAILDKEKILALLSPQQEKHNINMLATIDEALIELREKRAEVEALLRHHMSAKNAEIVIVPGYEAKVETTYAYTTDCDRLILALQGNVKQSDLDKAIKRKEIVEFKADAVKLKALKKLGGIVSEAIDKYHVRHPKSTKLVITPIIEIKQVTEYVEALAA